ncbi:uncharacterized protein LJ206_013296 [Theristicus caerulescens]
MKLGVQEGGVRKRTNSQDTGALFSLTTLRKLCGKKFLGAMSTGRAGVKLKAWAAVIQPASVLERNLQRQMGTVSSFVTTCQTGMIKKCCSSRNETAIPASPMTHPREYLRHLLLAIVGDKIPVLMNLLPDRQSCSCRTTVCGKQM